MPQCRNIILGYGMAVKANKREARLKRKIDKEAKEKDKNARLGASIQIKENHIKSLEIPQITKTPRTIPLHNYKEYQLTWCTSQADLLGRWKWGEYRQWTALEYDQIIHPHMDSQTSSCWNEIETRTYSGKNKVRKLLNKYQQVDSLCKEAQKRWLELDDLAQFEELFRFRIGTDRRIWGIRIDAHFFLVWYERNHRICPVKD